ncbi:coiled-coil-helix-coiled-coil-helix domain-containing protein 7 [Phlebotomus argentipes]|uniref:coiled-coil-helix-coiled-coil-helix domain-containing protein 7 n=1 Tax=Phlebotomus argentipes TaxID=94469 RepID=UPI0028937BFD|nr:coiled-coil-helix-coiled-coil-helix domain-containing protein 7 [Phlebotomus argentipes]
MPKNPDAEKNNPCLKEQEMSYKCLDKNNYDHGKCEMYFQNYKNCKHFWGRVMNDRKIKGIQPYLPNIAERESIKAEYMNASPK